MTEQEKQAAEKLRNSSEFIRAAESFARYAHQEWVQGCEGKRALMMCCVDRTIPNGIGSIGVATGNSKLLTFALVQMQQQDDTVGRILRVVSENSETMEDADEKIHDLSRHLRGYYYMAAGLFSWALCVIGFQLWDITNIITTVSNMLLIGYLGFLINKEIVSTRRTIRRITQAVRRENEERIVMLERKLHSMLDSLKGGMMNSDDD